MKSDFKNALQQLESIGLKRIASDFYMTPKQRGSYFFVKSPGATDKTWSMCLYPNNRFYDFACGASGDCIGFVSYIRGCNQWQALETLKEFYSLSGNRQQDRERMRQEQEQDRERQQRENAFMCALNAEIDSLKRWEHIYRLAHEKRGFEPFSELWCYAADGLQRTQYKLDILTGAEQNEYRRMKEHSELPTDYFQWRLDTLEILAESGRFKPTEKEIEAARVRRDAELLKYRKGREALTDGDNRERNNKTDRQKPTA